MTEAQKIEYEAQGYLVLEGGLDSGELPEFQTAFDRVLEEDSLEDLPNRDDRFIHLALHPTFFPIVHRILSDDVQIRTLCGRVYAPGNEGMEWRREVAGLLGVTHEASTLCVQVHIHLDETPDNGTCIAVVPGSHRFKSSLQLPDLDSVEAMPHAKLLKVEAGTTILLHGNLWQAQTRNGSDVTQRCIRFEFVHCWMRQHLPELSPESIEIISESHNLSQLFGGGEDFIEVSKGYWFRTIEGYPTSTGLPERRFSELKVAGKGFVPNS